MELAINTNNICDLFNLKNSVSGEVITDASVSLTIYDSSGATVIGQPWPADMRHVANGRYRVTLSDALLLDAGRNYTGTVNAVSTDGQKAQWQLQLVAQPQKVY